MDVAGHSHPLEFQLHGASIQEPILRHHPQPIHQLHHQLQLPPRFSPVHQNQLRYLQLLIQALILQWPQQILHLLFQRLLPA